MTNKYDFWEKLKFNSFEVLAEWSKTNEQNPPKPKSEAINIWR